MMTTMFPAHKAWFELWLRCLDACKVKQPPKVAAAAERLPFDHPSRIVCKGERTQG
jgi:hypothetical protein